MSEDLLEFGRSPRPRWFRITVAAAVVLVLAVLVAIRVWPKSRDHPAASPTTTPAYLIGPTGQTRPWPTAPSACGGDTDLAIVSSTGVAETTGVRLMVGGSSLRTVDFDSGRSTSAAGIALRPGEFVAPATSNLAVTSSCDASGPNSGSRLVRIDAAGHATAGELLKSPNTYLMVGGRNAWSVSLPDDPAGSALLTPIGGGAPVQLPAGFSPSAIIGTTVVGNLQATAGGDARDDELVLVDAASGHIRAPLGPGAFLAAGDDLVLWTVGCRVGSGQPCTLNSSHLGGAITRTYQLPRPPGLGAAVVSLNGDRVAFVMERATQDPRYDQGHPIPPRDVTVLDLRSGLLFVVPNVELPAKAGPGLAFSDSFVVIALNAGATTRLLAWRRGLAEPYESAPVAGAGEGPPAIVALPRTSLSGGG